MVNAWFLRYSLYVRFSCTCYKRIYMHICIFEYKIQTNDWYKYIYTYIYTYTFEFVNCYLGFWHTDFRLSSETNM